MATRLDPWILSTRQPCYNESRSKCRANQIRNISFLKTNNRQSQLSCLSCITSNAWNANAEQDEFLKFTAAKIEDNKTNCSRIVQVMTLLERSTRVKPCSFSRL
ncbi:hypothetical protein EUGRSUZ_F00454 [Eucalyptus grandis]|uniref:Uncharacterized protein n=2 Tax=Eucalyptus grandis TaxID=71139 RepID=A0ACC3KAM6_EUCGR|nr:hypothetical protein EUGRSUZ_F00454 [Eucalyptus grandis]